MGRGEKKEKEEQDSIDYVIEIDDEREIIIVRQGRCIYNF